MPQEGPGLPQEGPGLPRLCIPPALPVSAPKPGGGRQETPGIEAARNKVRERKFKNSGAFPVSLSYLLNLLLLFSV